MQVSRAACLAVAIVVLPATAWAACRGRDLAGTYDLKAKSTGSYGTITTTCEIAVTRKGNVRGRAECRQRNQNGVEATAELDGGNFKVSRSCRVSGRIMIDGYTSLITKARMSPDRRKVVGKGRNALDDSPLTFTATRKAAAVAKKSKRERVRERRWWRRFWTWLSR